MKSLILASDRSRCKTLLKQIGIKDFLQVSVTIDESPLPRELPRHYALRMAQERLAVAEGDYVLAAQTVVSLGRRILPKARDKDTAKFYLTLLSGRRHAVYGALCLRKGERSYGKIVKTIIKFKSLSPQDIEACLESLEWRNMAGGYAIDGVASRYIAFLSGSYSNVVGLDVYAASRLLNL